MHIALTPTLFALKRALLLLRSKDPLVLSSSTAFFAAFSASPIIVILISVFGLLPVSAGFSQHLFRTIGATVGRETASQLESIVNNFLSIKSNWLITVLGAIFFIFASTTLLSIIKHAIEKIWNIKPKPSLRIRYHSRQRGTQLGFILFTGLLFSVSVFIDTSLSISLDYLQVTWSTVAIALVQFLHALFSIIMITAWFTVLFKLLPEATVTWDVAFSGGLLTGILFISGEFLLKKLLVYSRFETIFGTSASLALLLLFIFYCAFILYYGAAFTFIYGEMSDGHICAGKHANTYEERIIERNNV